MQRAVIRVVAVLLLAVSTQRAGAEIQPIPRRLPPTDGLELSSADRDSLTAELADLRQRLVGQLPPFARTADVTALLKAVELALLHNEFYAAGDLPAARELLALARQRVDQLAAGNPDWLRQRGRVVRGYDSRIDGSPQPYGLEIPDDLDFDRPAPLYVWLHGRGDKQTDLQFIQQRLKRPGQIAPAGAIVLHPFGRHCLGFKSAGEIDVLEAIEHACSQYAIDRRRIVLIGFSMGGAGAWHLGAHYTDRWVAISPGAGFAETAQYNQLTPDRYPAWYEQALWGVYDVPNYVRNLFNVPVVAYSGELDRQIQAARVMEAAFAEQQRELTHLIGPGMGHKYHPDTLAELLRRLGEAVERGQPDQQGQPEEVHLQTRTLRYGRMYWVQLTGLEQHWRDTRVDARRDADRQLRITTSNVHSLRLNPWSDHRGASIQIDGQSLQVPDGGEPRPEVLLQRTNGAWQLATANEPAEDVLRKRPGLQGPIDDVFLEPFLVVTPSGRSASARFQEWQEFELAHFRRRWRAVFRGQLREKTDREVTDQDLARYHLIVWGDADSNELLRRVLKAENPRLPIRWNDDDPVWKVGPQSYDRAHHVPVFIYPNPLNPMRYLVCNSGPTFREGHDRTNSLQNPKLPDWAVLDLRQPPDELSAGRVVTAGFFDEQWQWQAPPEAGQAAGR
ncbi:MAG: prolyl oligopeptidase family serine peptidase [Pirellulaceae bacterium]|nr:prolyl oligopeptidase family serine peptidase [Pirellulaceae bacterium]